MLRHLSVRNFVLIDSLDMDFGSGFHVITGETGSGKSLLLDAIFFCLGGKFDVSVVRQGEELCTVTLELDLPDVLRRILLENGIDATDDALMIKRQQYSNNRKKFFINDQMVTQKFVEEISEYLIEIHGQHGVGALLNVSSHLEILDSYGNLVAQKSAVSTAFGQWKALQRALDEINKERDLIEREVDYLEFVVNELAAMNIKEGEEAALAEKRSQLQQQDKNNKVISDLLSALSAPDITSQIVSAQKVIYKQVKDDSFKDIIANLDQALLLLEEVKNTLEYKLSNLEQMNLEDIEERLFAIRAMARKHNIAPDELHQFLEDSKAKLATLKDKVENQHKLSNQIDNAQKSYQDLALTLSRKRQSTALELEQRVLKELAPLKMDGATLKIEFKQRSIDNAASSGMDDVRFIGSTNPGSALAPIDKIASGGELARFMLALKVVLFDKFTKPTIIFDEVDTGIGGMVADAVGERLKTLGSVAQVIAITHQPQVAGKADHHILASKQTVNGVTTSSAELLSRDARVEEVARMISGQKITDDSRKAAEVLVL